MTLLLGIIATLLILTLVVFVHEMGHFLMARCTKMKVEEFGIGIPPKAKNLFTDKKGTQFTLNWLPIGGFVRIKGEDSSSKEAHESDSFSAKSWWARSLVLVAGVLMNFLLAWVLLSFLFWKGSSPLAVNFLLEKEYGSYFLPSVNESLNSGFLRHEGILLEPIDGGVAQKFGIQKGDILIKVDATEVRTIDTLIKKIETNTPMEFTLISSGSKNEYRVGVLPKNGKIQSLIRYNNLEIERNYTIREGFFRAIEHGFLETGILIRITFDFLGKTLHDLIIPLKPQDREIAKEMIAGPIGMGAGMVELVKVGMTSEMIILMIALLSINLGVFNIIPFPALDGGRLLTTTGVAILSYFTKKRNIIHRVETIIHSIGMLFLLFLTLIIAFYDILKL